ncbi:helix-turn-helix domain-containing protein [Lachnoclostridium sp. Marseille-P6806]|uniref:helix-turn-helix domain-containing protein n=1 Tax=Lachnoclostridium sp. Marseille-P6806 TaxID=2364793 RepID=UPI00102FEE9D|nr:helix-turn-helix domain-containing protein [Lachnoclostridium sp. Marseille-P6806]
MTLLLVDDEYLMVEAIRKRIEDLHIPELTEIRTAYSAEQAKRVYAAEPVDILVTDVAMPREDGLSLVKWVREQGSPSVNLLLTGHEDFVYAKSAIHLQCFRYILKPINVDELAEALRDAAALCRKQQEEKNASASAVSDRIDRFWQEMLSGGLHPGSEDVNLRLAQIGLGEGYTAFDFCFTLLRVQPLRGDARDILQSVPASELHRVVRSVFQKQLHFVTLQLGSYILISDPAEEAGTLPLLDRTLELLTERWPDCRFVLYTMDSMPGGAAYYVCELLERCAASFIATENAVIAEDELQKLTRPVSDIALPTAKWADWLLAGRIDDILMELRAILLHEGRILSSRRLTCIYYDFLNMTFRVMAERHIGISTLSVHANIVETTSSAENLLHWASRILASVTQASAKSASSDSVIQAAKQYISQHLDDPDLSRNSIAGEIHISPDYLSYLFHRETGTVLSSYITEQRIEASKKLLRTTQEPLTDIALAVGYADSTYYCRQFRKVTGQTPGAYRSSMKKK